MKFLSRIPKSLTFLFWMTVLTGIAYPALVTLAAQLAFPLRANGSLLVMGGAVRGSSLLSQKFASQRFFQARPSATDFAYVGSGASNLGPVSADLAKAVADRRAAWRKAFGTEAPEDMAFASGSGLDPDISLEAALAQVDSVAAARALGTEARESLAADIRAQATKATSPIGPPRVNVVSLNALMETDPRYAASKNGG